jgi:hypothetical protein
MMKYCNEAGISLCHFKRAINNRGDDLGSRREAHPALGKFRRRVVQVRVNGWCGNSGVRAEV